MSTLWLVSRQFFHYHSELTSENLFQMLRDWCVPCTFHKNQLCMIKGRNNIIFLPNLHNIQKKHTLPVWHSHHSRIMWLYLVIKKYTHYSKHVSRASDKIEFWEEFRDNSQWKHCDPSLELTLELFIEQSEHMISVKIEKNHP